MTRLNNRVWLTGLLFSMVWLSGCKNDGARMEVGEMLNSRYDKAQEYCIGRFVVEIPDFLVLSGGNSRYNGVTMRHEVQSDRTYQENLDKLVSQYRDIGKNLPPDFPGLDILKLKEVINLPHGDIVRYGQDDSSEGFVRISPNTWTLRTNRFEKLKSIVNMLEFRPEPGPVAIPEVRGYCTIYGFIPESYPSSNEREKRFYRKDDDPNFYLDFVIFNIGKKQETLAELEDNVSHLARQLISLGQLEVEKRAEPISLSFIEGEQSIDNINDPSGRSYNMIAQGNAADPEQPFIQIRMEAGAMLKEEADKLWYSILGSLKPRPGAF